MAKLLNLWLMNNLETGLGENRLRRDEYLTQEKGMMEDV